METHREVHPLTEIAAADAKGRATEEEKAHLRHPESLDHWQLALKQLQTNLVTQFQAKKVQWIEERNYAFSLPEGEGKAYYRERKLQYRRWKNSATNFRAGLESALRECAQLKKEHNIERTTKARQARKDSWPNRLGSELRNFLAKEGVVSPEHVDQRDVLLDRLEALLSRESEGEGT